MADTCYYVSKPGIHWKYKYDQADEWYESHPTQRKEHITFFEISSGAVCVTHQQPAHRAIQNETSGTSRGSEE
jgi:hypothetical protein